MSTALRIFLLLSKDGGTLIQDVMAEYDVITGKTKGTPSQKAQDAIAALEDILSIVAKVI